MAEIVRLQEKFSLFHEHWRPKLVASLNGQEVKVVKVQGTMSAKSVRSLLREQEIIVSPGVYDCYSARLAEQAGFQVVSSTGAGLVNARFGLPDVGIFSLRDNLDACRAIAAAIDVPISADAETGYGNAATVHYVVRDFESALFGVWRRA